MPRSAEEILAHADDLARRFEEHEPDPDRIKDARALRDIASAFERRATAERDVAAAVVVARAEGHSWAAIGAMLGTSGEAARQRYGTAKPGASKAKAKTRSKRKPVTGRSSSSKVAGLLRGGRSRSGV
jgi:hypothetical protein